MFRLKVEVFRLKVEVFWLNVVEAFFQNKCKVGMTGNFTGNTLTESLRERASDRLIWQDGDIVNQMLRYGLRFLG